MNIEPSYLPPSWTHPLGTDAFGRSGLHVLLEGTVHTAIVVLVALAIATAIGLVVGAASALTRSRLLHTACRAAFTLAYATPVLMVILLVIGFVGDRLIVFPIVAGAFVWGGIALATETSLVETFNASFSVATRALGATQSHVFWKHLLPNAIPHILASASSLIPPLFQLAVILSFLGVGGGEVGLGALIRQGYDLFPRCWWLWLPATLLTVLILCGVPILARALERRIA